MDYLTLTIGKQKKIALIAHDSKKRELIGWCDAHKEILKHHFLCGTGTTARMVTDATGLPVKGYNSGPLGGDQQIGAKIVEGGVDFVVFFSDPPMTRMSRPFSGSPRSMISPLPTIRPPQISLSHLRS